jgi:hypothetical protein
MRQRQARPIYHRKRDSIEAHLTIVFAALAVSRRIEEPTGWSIRKFAKADRRYRTIDRALQRGRRLQAMAEAPQAAQDDLAPAARAGLDEELRALALISLGSAEFWAARPEDAERHLE